ncbi:MAG: hypothetical protein JSS09_01860, partial [Verrucomicrobia bacterium]|nr:hypothetical protein [Verrucomicrobiota bacterium]
MKILPFLTLIPLIAFGSLTEDVKPAANFPLISLEETRPLLGEDEVKTLEKLIEVNEQRLEVQKKLKEKMVLFKKQKEEFISGNESQ